jgi:type IV pilus assembly protein PilQ
MMNLNHRTVWQACASLCIASVCGIVHAQDNSIESISANQQGSNVIVKVAMKKPVQKPPIGFSITSPARIALDFADTRPSIKSQVQEIGMG